MPILYNYVYRNSFDLTWRIKLRYDAYSPQPSKLYDLLDVFRGVHQVGLIGTLENKQNNGHVYSVQ